MDNQPPVPVPFDGKHCYAPPGMKAEPIVWTRQMVEDWLVAGVNPRPDGGYETVYYGEDVFKACQGEE